MAEAFSIFVFVFCSERAEEVLEAFLWVLRSQDFNALPRSLVFQSMIVLFRIKYRIRSS